MPALTAAELALLRAQGHQTNLYLIVQQPMYRQADAWVGYFWACQINGAPAGAVGDLVAQLTINNGVGAVSLLDGMTVYVGSTLGAHDRGIFYIRGDQNVNAATNALNIGGTSEVVGNVQNDDWVVVLDEFRIWRRDPRITEAGGVLSWFKDYNVTFASLGANVVQRAQACLPPIPVMGPHRVAFIEPGSSVDLTFDWSDSRAMYPAAAVNDWDAWGEDGGAGWNVNNDETPPAQTYANISGLGGYRVRLEVGHNVQNPPTRFRRGIRYVFTLRRPGQTQPGDPPNAEPITAFELQSATGSFDQGYWRAAIRIYGEQAHEYEVTPGALVVLFAEDWYGGAQRSIGPITGAENILMVGRVADGSIRQDSETGDVTFDVISAGEVATRRESYPIPVERNDAPAEWYQVPGLTIDRAAWHYVIWHTTVSLCCDYATGAAASNEIAAMDFVAESIYQSLDSFYWERAFARLLCNRYEQFATPIDRQMEAAGGGVTIWALQPNDWLGQADLREISEPTVSAVDLAGVHYNGGLNDPYLARAPGDTSLQYGKPQQSTYLSIAGQAELNTMAGRLLAYKNNRWPALSLALAGNWRVADIWPQEYVNVTLDTARASFSGDLFIVREVSFAYDAAAGVVGVTLRLEYETDGPDGKTVAIPEEPPGYSPAPPRYGPYVPAWPGVDGGRRIVSTNVGVFATDDITQSYPHWYDCNTGIPAGSERCWWIARDPWHWWTSGGTERTLWGVFTGSYPGWPNLPRYVYKMTGFPYGTWVQMLDSASYVLPNPAGESWICDLVGTIERPDTFYTVIEHRTAGLDSSHGWFVYTADSGASWSAGVQCTVNPTIGFPTWPGFPFKMDTAKHSAASTIYLYQSFMTPGLDWNVRKSTNGGASWSTQTPTIGPWAVDVWGGITVPYHSATWTDQDVIIRAATPTLSPSVLQRSTNGGASWLPIGENVAMTYRAHSVPTSDKDTIAVVLASLGNSQIRITKDGGTTWTTWATMAFHAGYAAQFDWSEGSGGAGAALKSVTVTRIDGGFEGVYWVTPGGIVSDRTGNLRSFGVTSFSKVERDTMGAA